MGGGGILKSKGRENIRLYFVRKKSIFNRRGKISDMLTNGRSDHFLVIRILSLS